MKGDFVHLGAGALSQNLPHDEFLELCALSASGDLTHEEQLKLDGHLAVCQACRDVFQEYKTVVDEAMPAIAAEQDHRELPPGPRWSQRKAEKRFFDRLAGDSRKEPKAADADRSKASRFGIHRVPPSPESAWNHMWMLYAAGIFLFAALSLFTYRIGMHHSAESVRVTPPQPSAQLPGQPSLEEQLSDASHDRELARSQIAQRDRTITDLRRQLARQADEIGQMKTAQARLEDDLRAGEASKQEVIGQRADLGQKLESAQGNSRALQQELDSLAQQSSADDARARVSDAKVSELTRLLEQRETELEKQDQLLAHDRDIRDLMGARDLYVAEVYDIAGTGETKKPYGRVFYTRGKSLIFYAYDLDQEPGLKRANAFQAWGRRGPDRQQAVNLGIFYEDIASRKRWILKCDDPKTLAQIDGVFVTVEPKGGSRKPGDRTLLSAYLKINPNHP